MPLSRERRSRGAEERRSGGAEEQRKKNTIFLNPWVFPYIGSFFSPQTPYMGVDKMHHPSTCHQWEAGGRRQSR
ncbi:MAG: hypothetical protein F6K41_42625 [Symploca sp. SIO3E6]|nr:hypothetical protein [Caldora sp. SIO3E6]